jgi:hypothetical protein
MGGKFVGVWMEKIVDWGLMFPGGTKEECIVWLEKEINKSNTNHTSQM